MITLQQIGTGVGGRAEFYIRRDGEVIAKLSRYSHRTGWRILSDPYYQPLGPGFATLAEAKAYARTANFPSTREIYEGLCERVEKARRHDARRGHADELAAVAQAAIDDPVGAHIAAKKLLAEIEAYATDRTQINPTGYGGYIPQDWTPKGPALYPKPPDGS